MPKPGDPEETPVEGAAMQVLVEYASRSDEELAELIATARDREALGALYERHVEHLYGYASRIVRDRDEAADIVQTTYVKAWDALGRRHEPVGNVRGWLFSIARNTALDEMRRSGRLDLRDDAMLALDSAESGGSDDPAVAAMEREVAELVWEAAEALSDDDHTLLTLHLRHGLSADELSVALGLTKGAVYTRLSRLRDAVEEAVTSTLLVRHGRPQCPELAAIVGRLPADATARRVRRAVLRHANGCDRCEETRRRFVSPLALLGVAPPLLLTPALRARMWEGIRDGRTPARTTRRPAHGGAATVAAVIAAGVGLVGLAAVALGVGGTGTDGAPRDPTDVHSITHRADASSTARTVTMAWSRQVDMTGFSVSWDHDPDGLPDTVVDLPGDAVAASSPRLAPGMWWFHLRTRGENGRWTSTVHVGPFRILPAPPPPPAATTTTAGPPTTTTTVAPVAPTTATTVAVSVAGTTVVRPPSTTLATTTTATTAATTTTARPTTSTTRRTTTTASTTTTTTVPTTTTTTAATTTTTPWYVPEETPPTSEPPPAPTVGTVEGAVTASPAPSDPRAPIETPIPGAVVTIGGIDGPDGTDGTDLTTTTGEDGRYRLVDVPSGDVLLRVVAEGYEPVTVDPVTVTGGEVTTVDVVMTPVVDREQPAEESAQIRKVLSPQPSYAWGSDRRGGEGAGSASGGTTSRSALLRPGLPA